MYAHPSPAQITLHRFVLSKSNAVPCLKKGNEQERRLHISTKNWINLFSFIISDESWAILSYCLNWHDLSLMLHSGWGREQRKYLLPSEEGLLVKCGQFRWVMQPVLSIPFQSPISNTSLEITHIWKPRKWQQTLMLNLSVQWHCCTSLIELTGCESYANTDCQAQHTIVKKMAWNVEKAFDAKERKVTSEDGKGSARRPGCTEGTLKHILHGC